MRVNSDLITLLSYAASGSKVRPETGEYDAGTVPGQELPAYWWNYLINVLTTGHDKTKVDLDNLIAELNTLLTAAGITPDNALTDQVMAAITKLYYKKITLNISTDVTLTPNAIHLVEANIQLNLTLPTSVNVGDIVYIKAFTPCKIVQSDIENSISWDRTIFTTKGVNGYLLIPANSDIILIYKDSGWIKQAPVKITNPAILPTEQGSAVAWSPDSRYLAVAHNVSPFLTIYDWSSGAPVKIADPATLPPSGTTPKGIAWSPNGRYLVIGYNISPWITIYDWSSGVPIKIADPATLPTSRGEGLTWSPDSRYLAVAHTTTPRVTIYDWISSIPVKITDPATLPVSGANAAAWSPDGRYLAIVIDSTAIAIYDWISGIPVKVINPSTLPAGFGQAGAWSPDSRYLAVGSSTTPFITIYDWISGAQIKIANPVTLPSQLVTGVAWSPNGRYLAVTHAITPFITIYDTYIGVNKEWQVDLKVNTFRNTQPKNVLAPNFH